MGLLPAPCSLLGEAVLKHLVTPSSSHALPSPVKISLLLPNQRINESFQAFHDTSPLSSCTVNTIFAGLLTDMFTL